MLPPLSVLLHRLALIFVGIMSFSSAPLHTLAVACAKTTTGLACRVAPIRRRTFSPGRRNRAAPRPVLAESRTVRPQADMAPQL